MMSDSINIITAFEIPMEIILFCLTLSLLAASLFLYFKLQNLKAEKLIFFERSKIASEKLQEQNKKLEFLEEQNSSLLIYKGRFSESEINSADLKLQNQKAKNELEALNKRLADFDKQNELLKQREENLQKERAEWTIQKENMLHKLSAELIKKNSEEQNKFGEKNEENIKKITENLFKNFEGVVNKVSSLSDDMKKTSDEVNLTKNALLSPGGAGRTSEITLENILKSSGLKEKLTKDDAGDFILQSHFFGSDKSGKRPDAVVFLPANHVLIIDSKSSSHFLELQRLSDENNLMMQKEIHGKIKETMRKHLEDLKKKDYAKAKLEELGLQDIFGKDSPPIITTVMFLQTEKMLEIVGRFDSDIEQKALDAGIHILSPIGLINLLNQAKFSIDKSKQDKNIAQLKIEIKKIIESIALMFERASEVGKSVGKSAKSYNDFVTTFNGRFLSRISNMGKFGIEFDKKNISGKLKKIENDGELIEGELVEIENELVESHKS